MSQEIGFAIEKQIRTYLIAQGLKHLTSNYYCRYGEIDLVMQEKDCIVFVEVRARTSLSYGGAAESVTYNKIKKIIKSALFYLRAHQLNEHYPTRFDVVSVEGVSSDLRWIKNAFGLDF